MTASCQESRAFKRIELDKMNIEDFFLAFSWKDYRQNKIDGGFQARIWAPSGVWCLPNTLKWDSGSPMALNVRANPSTGDPRQSLAVYPSFSQQAPSSSEINEAESNRSIFQNYLGKDPRNSETQNGSPVRLLMVSWIVKLNLLTSSQTYPHSSERSRSYYISNFAIGSQDNCPDQKSGLPDHSRPRMGDVVEDTSGVLP
jgi:hypothetical protein